MGRLPLPPDSRVQMVRSRSLGGIRHTAVRTWVCTLDEDWTKFLMELVALVLLLLLQGEEEGLGTCGSCCQRTKEKT